MAINAEVKVGAITYNGTPLELAGGSDTPSTEWQPNPTWWDIKTILDNDTRDYPYKTIYLYTNATVSESSLELNGVAYSTSDGEFYETSTLTHTWDLTQDKPCYIGDIEVYKTRYVVVYSNSYAKPKSGQQNLLWFYGLNTSGIQDVSYLFQGCYSLQSISEIDTSSATTMRSAFGSYSLQSIPKLNMSNVTSTETMFANCYSLRSIPDLDTSSVTYARMMFYNCYCLQSVPKLDIINVSNVDMMFNNCYALSNLKLFNIKTSGLTIGSSTSFGHLLSQESLIHTIKQLWDYSAGTTTYTLTMGSANTAKLANVYVKLITATDEMVAEDPNINSKMPCEVCESTDEGAMLIMDYASAKGWTIS